MKKRPVVFTLISAVFLAIAVSFPLQVSFLYGHGLSEIPAIFDKLTIFNWLSIFALTSLSYMALNGSRWLYVAIPITLVTICWNNYLVGFWGYDYNMTTTFFSSLAFSFLCLFPFLPDYASVIQNPAKRWWLVATRKEIHIPVYISQHRGPQYQTKTVDISKTGAFLESCQQDMHLGDVVDLNLKINTLQNLQVKAEVVRLQQESQRFGVRFQELETDQKKLLSKYLESH